MKTTEVGNYGFGHYLKNWEMSMIIKMKTFSKRSIIPLLVLLLIASHALSDVELPGVFGDNMVLQRGIKAPVWGTADPGEKITVSIKERHVRTKAGKDGRWKIRLKKMKAGGPYEMTVTGKNTITFANVMVGDVWVCSGQSNMAFRIASEQNIEDEIASADYPEIRMLTVGLFSRETPQYDFPGKRPVWITCSPETVRNFSAVAFFFGKELHTELGVPIGLLHTSWGGSVAEAWTSHKALNSKKELKPIIENLELVKANYPEDKELYEKKIAEWGKAMTDGKPLPEMPLPPRGPETRDYPSGLYNAMLFPMIPYGIRGAIWYQGESNSVRAWQYRTLFPTMIKDWRRAWKQGNFTFLFVQLANWETDTIPVNRTWGSWAELREAQLMTLSLPMTGMAVTIDIGNANNIHPNNKWDVGKRLALAALHSTYDRDVVYSGPIYKSMKKDGCTIRLSFKHVANGLSAGNAGQLNGFTIAGKDKIFYQADALIDGDKVVVSSGKVPDPVAVRYAWDDNPECNLYNSVDLPASPFRTDKWPEKTRGRLKP